jgi:hypothetical protein
MVGRKKLSLFVYEGFIMGAMLIFLNNLKVLFSFATQIQK